MRIDAWPGFNDVARQRVVEQIRYLAGALEPKYPRLSNITFHRWQGSFRFFDNQVSIFVCSREAVNRLNLPITSFDGCKVRINDEDHTLSVPSFSTSWFDPDGATFILDDTPSAAGDCSDNPDRIPLAGVFKNNVVIFHDISAKSDRGTNSVLSRVINVLATTDGILDFNVEELLLLEKKNIVQSYTGFYGRNIYSRYKELSGKVNALKTSSTRYYESYIAANRDLIAAELELKTMESISKEMEPQAEKQARMISRLLSEGVYEAITLTPEGAVLARTSPIRCSGPGRSDEKGPIVSGFLGRFDISIFRDGSLHIWSADYPKTDSCHPHIDSGGRPCLGNMASVMKMIGAMRIAEALSVLHAYLESYTANDSYTSLSSILNSVYACPGSSCPNYQTPYCIMTCNVPSRRRTIGCDHCTLRGSDWCFAACPYNGREFPGRSTGYLPCPRVCKFSGVPGEYCFTDCEYNTDCRFVHPSDVCRPSSENDIKDCKYGTLCGQTTGCRYSSSMHQPDSTDNVVDVDEEPEEVLTGRIVRQP